MSSYRLESESYSSCLLRLLLGRFVKKLARDPLCGDPSYIGFLLVFLHKLVVTEGDVVGYER